MPQYICLPSLFTLTKYTEWKKLPKRIPCSRHGKYLVVSPYHSFTIGRILNLTTGFFIPQYHMVYDDQFTSVQNYASDGLFSNENFSASMWEKLINSGLECHVNPEDFDPSDQHHGCSMPELNISWITLDEGRWQLPPVMDSDGELERATSR